MKSIFLFIGLGIFSGYVFSDVKYFNGKVERVETCKSNGGTVFVYFKEIVGAAPVSTNGCSNDISLPYVRLNSNTGTLSDMEKSMLSTILTAQASERSLRVRYDDQSWFVQSIAVD